MRHFLIDTDTAGDDAVATHDDSSDGYLVGIEGYAGLLEGL